MGQPSRYDQAGRITIKNTCPGLLIMYNPGMIDYYESDKQSQAYTDTLLPLLAEDIYVHLPDKMVIDPAYVDLKKRTLLNARNAMLIHAHPSSIIILDKKEDFEIIMQLASH